MYHAMACLTVPKLYISVSFRKLAKRGHCHISLAMGLRPCARFARGWSSAKTHSYILLTQISIWFVVFNALSLFLRQCMIFKIFWNLSCREVRCKLWQKCLLSSWAVSLPSWVLPWTVQWVLRRQVAVILKTPLTITVL